MKILTNLFRFRQVPLTPPMDVESQAWHLELDAREAAFEAAVEEMGMARLDTATILDLYLTAVTR